MKLIQTLVGIVIFCGSLWSAAPAYTADIDALKMQQMIKAGAVVIDIRTAPEWRETGVIAGSNLITFFDERGGYNIGRFMMEMAAVVPAKDTPVIIICRTGSRSVPVADFLARNGFTNVYNQKHGIMEWITKKLPLVSPGH